MQPTYTAFGPPSASHFVHEFRRTWWPGAWWTRGLLNEKVQVAYRVDALDLPFDDRERLVNLLHGLTALHVVEHSRWLMSILASVVVNYLFFWSVPSQVAAGVAADLHLPLVTTFFIAFAFRLALFFNFQMLASVIMSALPAYSHSWRVVTDMMRQLYRNDLAGFMADLMQLRPLDRFYPGYIEERLVRRFGAAIGDRP